MVSHADLANALRVLSMDAVQRAHSGHPGMPMGMADIATVLWREYLRHDPSDPSWPDRDRFVLSNGHGSMLLYALLHLTGYDLPMKEIKNFRQLQSRTPGHPEYSLTPGVETTTGPLGQGLANAVGMALAEKILAARFNRRGHCLINHTTYAFVGDGCLMEGISHEVCSLAGNMQLGKLIVFYDSNGISIDGAVSGWFTDDTAARFAAYGWQTIAKVDGHDPKAIRDAIEQAREDRQRPTLICCHTVIGRGAPNKQGSAEVHGAPLGREEVAAVREALNWQYEPFKIPQEIRQAWDMRKAGQACRREWEKRLAAYRKEHADLAESLERCLAGRLPGGFAETARQLIHDKQLKNGGDAAACSTRKASRHCLDVYAPLLPELIGGSADLSDSNNTRWAGSSVITGEQTDGNYIHFGVREFGMSAILNGIALHGGFIPYGGTFLVFMEYARHAVRLAALMKQRCIFIYTHDSIGLGEDGPTHQPIEQLSNLRSTPNLSVWRPCDTVETAVAWQAALERQEGPTALVLSRQSLPGVYRDLEQLENIARGAYVLREPEGGEPEGILIATGSEVSVALAAAELLALRKRRVRVVSMPSADCFERQGKAYRELVLPAAIRCRVVVEAGHPDWWYRYAGLDGKVLGINCFGASAPAEKLFEYFGFTPERVADATEKTLSA